MMTDLASLISATTAQPGATALAGGATNGSLIGLPSTPSATIAAGDTVASPIAATTFQIALAAQIRISAPVVQPASIELGNAGVFAAIIPSRDPDTRDETLGAASPLPTLPGPTLALPKAPPVPPITSPVPVPPIAIALPVAPDTAAPAFKMPAPAPEAPVGTAQASASQDDNGKLPSDGKILPLIPIVRVPKTAPPLRAEKVEIGATDDRSTSQADATDAPIQPVPTLAPVIVPTLPASLVAPPPTGPTQPRRTTASIIPAAVPALPVTPGAIAAVSIAKPGAAEPAMGFAAIPAPMPEAPAASAASPTIAAQSAAIAPIQTVADVGTSGAVVTPQTVVVTMAAPALAPAAPSAPVIPLSTASRLARQSGVARIGDPAAPTSDSASAPTPVIGALPAPLDASNAPAVTAPAVATPPQDFAALVDRLLEARASAQSSAPPQQISTSVTHADFGKVSLSFQHGAAGLSVSMTSADPDFARAAQSAIGGSAGVSTPAASGLVIPDQPAGTHVTANQHPIADAGSFGQGFAQPDARPQGSPGATGQGSANFSASGGSPQSQAEAQPQQRHGFIAAASRAPAASNSSAPATSHSIFA